jgi:hypothetical protein
MNPQDEVEGRIARMKNAQLVGGESGIWVNGRMREVERLGPFQILERDWDLGYICHLRAFTMVSCMLLSHWSQAVQTSRFSAARVQMNTCRM